MTGLKVQANKIYSVKDYKIFILFFFLFSFVLMLFASRHSIGDFGNYYYGSKFFWEGIDPLKFYKDLHFFNSEIRKFEDGVFFENYTPVPPFSLIIYLPFLIFKCTQAKFIFNLLGLLVLSASLYRMVCRANFFNYWFYFLPVIFLQPLYSNFYQGQTYLFTAALLLEFFMAYQVGANWRAGLIIATLLSLKVFPVFIIVIPLFKKEWKILISTFIFTFGLSLLTIVAIGGETFVCYVFEILPRLTVNEITEPFSYLNQSFHSMLLNTFVFDKYRNPNPYINSVFPAVVLQVLFYTFILSFLVNAVKDKKQQIFSFFVTILALILINKYSTVYGLLILIPFIFSGNDIPGTKFIWASIILFIACNIPVSKLDGFPFIIRYSRLWLLILLFFLYSHWFNKKIRWSYIFTFFILAIFPSMIFYRYSNLINIIVRPQNGALYDFQVLDHCLKLHSCLGNRDTAEIVDFNIRRIDSLSFIADRHRITVQGKPIYISTGQVKKPVLVNDTDLVFMTDENRGVGLFVLCIKRLK